MINSTAVRIRRMALFLAVQLLLLFPLTNLTFGQAQTSAVPRLVKFSGTVNDGHESPRTGIVGLTFALYKDEQGGVPLWLETQNVALDSSGDYTVELGATLPNGLPQELFASGEARWLAVQPEGHSEQPRVLLLSVPYALKAADAETLGGLPLSAFVLAAPATANPAAASSGAVAAGPNSVPPPNAAVTGAGTVNFIPLWDTTSDIVSSAISQTGTGATAKIGINTAAPSTTLDVKGAGTIRGALSLPAVAVATATKGSNSQPFKSAASSFSSGTNAAVNQTFQWQAEAVGNNSATPSGSMNLLFGSGASLPSETGLKISNTGVFTFAIGQTFPGVGTITGVTAGSGLSGGGTNGNITLSLPTTCATNQILKWTGSAWACSADAGGSGTITGVTAGTGLTGGGTTGTVTLNLDTTKIPQLSAANIFTNSQSVTGNLTASGAVTGSVINTTTGFSIGGTPFAFADTGNGNQFLAFAGNATTTGAGIVGTGLSALAANTTGSNNTANGSRALSLNTTGGGNTATGYFALGTNSTGISDTADGALALESNTTGAGNTASGEAALSSNTTGQFNTALGSQALTFNATGSNNTALGYLAGPDSGSVNLTNATAIGAFSQVSESNAVVLGGTGPNAVKVGIGTTTPASTLDVRGTGSFTGLVTFAAGQTFPGTGTITGVTAGTGLTGGGTSGGVTLNVDTTKVVTAITAGTGLTGGGTGGVQTLNLDTTKVPLLSAANLFTTSQSVTGNLTASGTVTGSVVNATTSFNLGGIPFDFTAGSGLTTFLGFAGNSTTTGNSVVGVGSGALQANTSGGQNTATGVAALLVNTTGSFNTADGWDALLNNTTGGNNTALGASALFSATTGSNNTATGDLALLNNTIGSGNAAFGYNAGNTSNFVATTGSNNTFVGTGSGSGTQTALNNATAIGALASVTQNNSLILGSINGINGSTADTSVGIGTTAPVAKLDVHGTANFTGLVSFVAGQTFPGTGTITGVTAGTGLTGGGTSGGVTLNVDTTKVVTAITAGTGLTGGGTGGAQTLNLDTTKVPQLSAANIFTNNQSITGNLTASGTVSGGAVNTGTSFNLGGSTFAFGSTQTQNVFLGFAGNSTTSGSTNTGAGYQALMSLGSGESNTAFGALALLDDTVGTNNTAVGYQSLLGDQEGFSNTAIGVGALTINSSGSDNTAIGTFAMYYNGTGSDNTALGFLAGPDSTTPALTNATAIGAFALVTKSNTLVLGGINGVNGFNADTNVGIGTTAPQTLLHVDHKPPFGGQDVLLLTTGGSSDVASLALQSTVAGGLRLREGVGTGSAYLSSTGGMEFITSDTGNPTFPSGKAMTIDTLGNVHITGNLSKGGGSFKIDHPLDPANKYLSHSFVESPDMMNIYNGVATLDARGAVWITLPDYFGALNRDFRYQLTSMGRPQPELYIAKEISGSRFRIAGGKPGGRVSWQVTGIRQDAYANAHRIPVEEDKPAQDQGHYLHPELFGAAPELAIGTHPAAAGTTHALVRVTQ